MIDIEIQNSLIYNFLYSNLSNKYCWAGFNILFKIDI